MKPLFFLLVASMLLLNSCLTQNLMQKPVIKNAMPDGFFISSAQKQYVIKQSDKISLSVWSHDDLSVGSLFGIYNSNEVYGKWVMLDANGEVPIPKIGMFKLQGLTVLQAEDTLRKILSKWILSPLVAIKVLNKEVVVMGEIKMPGRLTLEKENYRLTEIIALSGDFDFYANKKKIIVVRNVDGFEKQLTIDLTHSDNFSSNNINILPGDLVYVPSKRSKDFDKRVSSVAPFTSVVTALAIIYTAFLKK